MSKHMLALPHLTNGITGRCCAGHGPEGNASEEAHEEGNARHGGPQ